MSNEQVTPKTSVAFKSKAITNSFDLNKIRPAIYQPANRAKYEIEEQLKIKNENELITELANNSIY